MELEELKNSRDAIKAPPGLQGKTMGASDLAMDNLMERLKNEDARQLKMLKRARPLWVIGAVFWVLSSIGIVLTTLESSRQIDSGLPLRGLIVLIFVGLSVALFVRIKRMSAIDYTEPASLFLRKAAKRYQFMSTPNLVLSILIASVLAWAASIYIVSVFERYLDIHDPSVGIIASFSFVALVFLGGYYASKKDWKKGSQPMLEEIKKLQEDLQGTAK